MISRGLGAALRARVWLLAALLLFASPAAGTQVSEVHYTMGTYFTITIDGLAEPAARSLMRQCFADAQQLDGVFSRYDAESELSRLNGGSGAARTVEVSADMADLLRRGLALRTATDGTFDVTIGALTALWREAEQWPSPATLRRIGAGAPAARARFADENHVSLAAGVQLDFDGVAKGYAVDRCVALLRAGGAPSALVSLGESSQYALGAPEGERNWSITLRDLNDERALGTLLLHDQALSVSSVFGHEHTVGLHTVGHIVDPRNGEALDQPGMAVVVGPSATDAEAFSKAFLIAPAPAGRTITIGVEHAPSGALVVRPDGISRFGSVAFQSFAAKAPIAAAAEPLR